MKAFRALCVALAVGLASGHRDFDEDIDTILSQREEVEPQLEKVANYPKAITKHSIMERFSNEDVATERGKVVVTRNKNDNEIMKIELEENALTEDLTDRFNASCQKNALYQLSIPDLDLVTSQAACIYFLESGLNDTLTFHTDASS